MCHDDDSLPPAPRGAVPAASDQPFELMSQDGTRVLAHEAVPTSPTGVGMVVLPDVRGLHEYYRHLAVRFAEIGVHAVAIDYFGRTAGSDDRSPGFEFRPHVERTAPETVAADVEAAARHLRRLGATSIFTVGFCFGGGYSWRQSADTPGLAGAIGFYGRPTTALDVVERMQAPLLMLIAGADENIPVEAGRELADQAPVSTEVVVFDGAPHSFFDRSFAEHRPACDLAWQHIQRFLDSHPVPVAMGVNQ